LKSLFTVIVEVEKHLFIEMHPSLVSMMSLKGGQLIEQRLLDNGTISLSRVQVENDDVGAGLTSKTLTPARQTEGGAKI
jgi:hypothetical protein